MLEPPPLATPLLLGDNSSARGDAETIYSALLDCLKQKDLQDKKIVGMGFDGANTFSGNRNGVQARAKKLAPHVLLRRGSGE